MSIIILDKKPLHEIQIVAKEAIIKSKAPTKSQVAVVFDVSGSMEGFYQSGIIDALATRILALGLELDDNGSIPVYALGDGVKRLPDLTKENLAGYTNQLHQMVGGGTNYAPTVNKIVDDAKEGDPMLVLLFTDGDNYDHEETEDALVDASKLPIFFQWYGIHRGHNPGFSFLEEINDLGEEREDLRIDNCGFTPLHLDIQSNADSTNDAWLYEDMLKEYKDFPNKAQKEGITWANKRRKIFGIF